MSHVEKVYLMNVALYINDKTSLIRFMTVNKKCKSSLEDLKINPYIPIPPTASEKQKVEHILFISKMFSHIETLQCTLDLLTIKLKRNELFNKITYIRLVNFESFNSSLKVKSYNYSKIENLYLTNSLNSIHNVQYFPKLKRLILYNLLLSSSILHIIKNSPYLKEIICLDCVKSQWSIEEIIWLFSCVNLSDIKLSIVYRDPSINIKECYNDFSNELKGVDVKMLYIGSDIEIGGYAFVNDMISSSVCTITGPFNNMNSEIQKKDIPQPSIKQEDEILNNTLKCINEYHYYSNDCVKISMPNLSSINKIIFGCRTLVNCNLESVNDMSITNISCIKLNCYGCRNLNIYIKRINELNIQYCIGVTIISQVQKCISIGKSIDVITTSYKQPDFINTLNLCSSVNTKIINQNVIHCNINESYNISFNSCKLNRMTIENSCRITFDKSSYFYQSDSKLKILNSYNNNILLPLSIKHFNIIGGIHPIKLSDQILNEISLFGTVQSIRKKKKIIVLRYDLLKPKVLAPMKYHIKINDPNIKSIEYGNCKKVTLEMSPSSHFKCDRVDVLKVKSPNILIEANYIGKLIIVDDVPITFLNSPLIDKKVCSLSDCQILIGKPNKILEECYEEIKIKDVCEFLNSDDVLNLKLFPFKKVTICLGSYHDFYTSKTEPSIIYIALHKLVEKIKAPDNLKVSIVEGGNDSFPLIRQLKLMHSYSIFLRKKKESVNRKQIQEITCSNNVRNLVIRNCNNLKLIKGTKRLKKVHIQSCANLVELTGLSKTVNLQIRNCPKLIIQK
ncbi:hypothetical protein EDI_291380 [Entamoeba dispar SAW760]|uniref:Uncharacterized protein n=1 Tax=Entamoeba dispar (strain ATCC PRA-260 / SAW760) TaxID=370354 RepID=B0EPI7_ENTDS|nr:uncharacterized protein EDI_291380 [Entamoeba dispar SAW760]EDR23564.1 hypothetical protein EDI_291380 [Entamoeba dispar SAW760]|eukprot:EDR23564.1 hypothetical protein EDI_291380 [Entamoeba dispar SAW760]